MHIETTTKSKHIQILFAYILIGSFYFLFFGGLFVFSKFSTISMNYHIIKNCMWILKNEIFSLQY